MKNGAARSGGRWDRARTVDDDDVDKEREREIERRKKITRISCSVLLRPAVRNNRIISPSPAGGSADDDDDVDDDDVDDVDTEKRGDGGAVLPFQRRPRRNEKRCLRRFDVDRLVFFSFFFQQVRKLGPP